MKDTLVVLMTQMRCRDAQYRVDKAISKILEVCGAKMEKPNR